MRFGDLRIATKLYFVVVVAAIALVVVAGASFLGARHMVDAGHRLHDRGAIGIAETSKLAQLFEQQRGLVGRVPAENDLQHQKAFRDRFQALSGEIDAKLGRIGELAQDGERDKIYQLATLFAAMRKQAAAVFDFAQNFVQDKATEVLDGSFAGVEKQLDAGLATLLVTFSASADRDQAELNDAGASMIQSIGWGLALGIGIVGTLAWLIARSVAGPLVRVAGAMATLAGGNLEIEVTGTQQQDEIGILARALLVFRDSAVTNRTLAAEQERMRAAQEAEKEARRQAEEQTRLEREVEKERQRQAEEALRAEREAEKDRQRQSQELRAARLTELMREFDRKVTGVLQTVGAASTELEATAGAMATTAEEANRQTTTVAAALQQASANIQTVASAAEELTSSIGEIGRQVTQSTSIAGKAVLEAKHTNETVKGLAEAAQKIGQVVEMINTIAGQTNLLALNATIEAARAGDAGKGFAVVASEVKALANQTAKATEEIGTQISSMQGVTEEVVSAIASIGGTITEISEVAAAIASAIEEQGAATQEIARNVQQVATGTHEVAANIDGVTGAAQQTGAAATQVLSSAGELSKQSAHLRGEVDQFLEAVKAA